MCVCVIEAVSAFRQHKSRRSYFGAPRKVPRTLSHSMLGRPAGGRRDQGGGGGGRLRGPGDEAEGEEVEALGAPVGDSAGVVRRHDHHGQRLGRRDAEEVEHERVRAARLAEGAGAAELGRELPVPCRRLRHLGYEHHLRGAGARGGRWLWIAQRLLTAWDHELYRDGWGVDSDGGCE